MFTPRMRQSFAAIATVLVFAAGTPTITPTPAPLSSAAPIVKQHLRNGCSQLVTQEDHRKYAVAVYKRPKISVRAQRQLRKLRLCQHTAKAGRNAREFERSLLRDRRERQSLARMGVRGIGLQEAARRGWTGSQWTCLNLLWNRESGWNHRASNSSSGAYGIPQALPGAKMASAGSDWATNPRTQIRWGLSYIASRYGAPCGAWSHSQATGWY